MATLTAQKITRTGLNPTLSAASGGGDDFLNTGGQFLYVDNADASPTTLTFDIQVTVDGQAVTDRTLVVPAGEFRLVGPFSKGTYNDANGKLQITYSSVTSLTIGVLTV